MTVRKPWEPPAVEVLRTADEARNTDTGSGEDGITNSATTSFT